MHRFALSFSALLAPALLAGAPARADFSSCVASLRAEGERAGISGQTIETAFSGLQPDMKVLDFQNQQPEFKTPIWDYLAGLVDDERVADGKAAMAREARALQRAEETYGVSRTMLAAIWGVESYFGTEMGKRPLVKSLSTLACYGGRAGYFRSELMATLKIIDRGDIPADRLSGSWAGAFGQTQFMPSSYLRFAEDYDGDGKRDIWSTPADIFASIANYMHGNGWMGGATWGREVSVSAEARRRIANEIPRRDGPCQARRDMTSVLPASRWRELGVRTLTGDALPEETPNAALVTGESRAFLVFRNYDALLEYNCAHSYAIGVGLLADALTPGAPPVAKAVSQKSKRPAKRKTSRKS